VNVVADGLQGTPIVNASGLFVWLREDLAHLRKITVDPGLLPYERVEITRAQLKEPPLTTTIELPPRVDYAFAAGVTGMRGMLIQQRGVPSPVAVRDAEVHVRWLDEDGVWRDAPASHTDTKGGDFVAILRFSPADVPLLDSDGAVTVRLRARRGADERESPDLKLPQGRIADPATFTDDPKTLIFAWDELQR
jgi:hypothetical protein